MTRTLLTGGAGFIGSHVAESLLQNGHRLLIVDNLATGAKDNIPVGAEFVHADIADAEAMSEVGHRFAPQVIVHLAAQADVAASTKDPASDARVNVVGTLSLLQPAMTAQCRKFIFASSSVVYGEPAHQPVRERDPLRPISPYGASKLAGEHYVRVVCDLQQIPYTILRFGNVFGPRDPLSSHHVITCFVDALLSGQRPTIEWDGEQMKDYVYVADVASAVVAAIDYGDNEVCNIGSGAGVSVNDLYRLVCAATGSSTTPLYAPKRPGDVRQFIMDCTRAQQVLGWRATTLLDEALGATIEHKRSRSPWRAQEALTSYQQVQRTTV